MRPTSTTNNSKTSGKSQILKTPFVSTPFRESKFNSTIWRNFCGSSFRFLTHSRYNFKRDCERRVKFGFEILVLERKFVIEKENEIDCYLHHGYGWSSRIYVKLWQVGPYSYLRNFPELWETEGRRPADLLIGNGNTNLRDASYEITKPNPLLIEKSHVADTKEGSVKS